MVKTSQEYLLNILQHSTTENVRYIKECVCFFSMCQYQSSLGIVFFSIFLKISSPIFFPETILNVELNCLLIFCRMQDIWRDIFTLRNSRWQSIVILQYHAVQTRAFLGKEGVYTLIYLATKILMHWGLFFLSLVMHIKIYITSSDKRSPSQGIFFRGEGWNCKLLPQ